MKAIILVECKVSDFTEMLEASAKPTSMGVNLENFSEEQEYTKIFKKIDDFIKSGMELLLVRFSGRERVAQSIGDEYSTMLICMSSNKENPNYTENPVKTFADLIDILNKGD